MVPHIYLLLADVGLAVPKLLHMIGLQQSVGERATMIVAGVARMLSCWRAVEIKEGSG
jgi:hypothetical protein